MNLLPDKRKALGLIASLFIAMSASAQDDEVKLVIHNHDGSAPVEISVYDVRKITFQDDHFTMVYEEGIKPDEQFVYDDVRKISFKNLITGIDNVRAERTDDIAIARNGSVITVSGVEDSARLSIYDIAGRPVMSRTINGDTEIDTAGLSAGVYILRVNSKTFKFSRL